MCLSSKCPCSPIYWIHSPFLSLCASVCVCVWCEVSSWRYCLIKDKGWCWLKLCEWDTEQAICQPAGQQTTAQLPVCVWPATNVKTGTVLMNSCLLLRQSGVYFRCIVSVSRQICSDQSANQALALSPHCVSFALRAKSAPVQNRCLVLPFLCLHSLGPFFYLEVSRI